MITSGLGSRKLSVNRFAESMFDASPRAMQQAKLLELKKHQKKINDTYKLKSRYESEFKKKIAISNQ